MANPVDQMMGRRLTRARADRGLDEAGLARRLGIPVERVQAYEAGRERVGAEPLRHICETLAVDPSFFFAWHRETSADEPSSTGVVIPMPRQQN